ncbi:MAG: hypothetical protein ACRENV_08815 [Candidatus Dormibacteria bacterium]
MVRSASARAIPRADYAILAGSGASTRGSPEDEEGVTVVGLDTSFATPFGPGPPLSLLRIATPDGGERRAAYVRRSPAPAAPAGGQAEAPTLALFWILERAGVGRILAESGAASITQHFHPRDLVVPHDFIDFTPQAGGQLQPTATLLMREPFCPEIRDALWQRARQFAAEKATRAFNRAVHLSVQGPRYETAAEVAALARMGGDVISHTVTPDVYLAREIGACFAAVAMVLNYAEGVRPEWDFELLRAIVREGAEELGRVALDALIALPLDRGCACASYRQLETPAEVRAGRAQ